MRTVRLTPTLSLIDEGGKLKLELRDLEDMETMQDLANYENEILALESEVPEPW